MRTIFFRPSPIALSTTEYANAPCSSACNSAVVLGGNGAGGSGAFGTGGGGGAIGTAGSTICLVRWAVCGGIGVPVRPCGADAGRPDCGVCGIDAGRPSGVGVERDG